jgi:hypothetical protein
MMERNAEATPARRKRLMVAPRSDDDLTVYSFLLSCMPIY